MQVTRRRRPKDARAGSSSLNSRRVRIVAAGTVAAAVAGGGMAYGSTQIFDHNKVGQQYAGGLQISDDQTLKSIGDRLVTKLGKIMGSTVSPDGRYLAASSTDKNVILQIFDLKTYKPVWTVGSTKAEGVNQKVTDGTVGQEGPTWSPDGTALWLPQKDGLSRFPVNADGSFGTPTTVPLPKGGLVSTEPGKEPEKASPLPGKSVYSADGTTLYVPLNGVNSVVALDVATSNVTHTWVVGIAPREISLVGGKLYVSNEGGRQALPGDKTQNSYGTQVPADPFLGTSTTGTVSVIDLARPSGGVASIDVGLHPTALYNAGNALFVANTNSDTVSVIDTTKDKVVQTIDTRPWASSSVGYQPTSVTLTPDGHLLVGLGRANALAVYRYAGSPLEPVSYLGLLPTDYYPEEVAAVGGQIVVTNTRGIDALGPALSFSFPRDPGTPTVTGPGTHSTTASLTRFTLPSDQQIAKYTATVFAQNGWGRNDVKQAKGNKQATVPVPARLGDPSTIKHVFLLVKENRTYDQVYGDIAKGNGDPTLAQFGEKVTPNQHALAQQFGLYDNAYDAGTNSAEGHNWVMQGDDPEYTESSAGEYKRSYDTENDVLGHQRSGFIWTAVESAGKTAKNFGEFTQFENKPKGATWQQYYCAATSGDPHALTDPSIKVDNHSPIPSLDEITNPDYPKFDTDIPDIYRYGIWKQDFEKNGPADLNMFWLSSDHTGGAPDPRAQVADNDVAVGKIVDEISHSKYWADSAIFVVEDDSQNGADHVDGHRAPVQIISPWAQHGTVDSTYYSQITMVRTIEQILGAQPLNQKLAAAAPMSGAFTNKPDFTPFTAVPNQVPLTEGLTSPPACGADTLGQSGAAAQAQVAQQAAAVAVPEGQKAVAVQWAAWARGQHHTGNGAAPDRANPEQMNRYTWYQTHAWSTPYPGDAVIYAPADVPGAYLPGSDSN